MRAADMMTACVVSISSDSSVFDAAELLVSMHFSALPVVDSSGKIVGIVSEADLMRRPEIGTAPHHSWLSRMLADEGKSAAEYVTFHSRQIADVMTRKVIFVQEDATLAEIAETMTKHRVKRVPVVRDNVVVGIASRSDLLRILMSREPQSDATVQSDAELRSKVLSAVSKQTWSSTWPTNVLVNAGVVHLWGFVSSHTISSAYRVAAENVPGVKKVKNHMRTVPAGVNMGV
jgi:CBS domain-containing protein